MGREEQKEEREVLESIFPEEITDISENEYRIEIKLEDVDGQFEEEEDGPPIILLKVSYPEAYPDVAPDLDLSAPPNAPRYENFDIQEDKAHLLAALEPSVEENLGMAMVFTLVTTIKDAAETLIAERAQAEQHEKDKEAARAEEEENKKFQGEAVTRESFLKWREGFMKEMEDAETAAREEKEAEDKKKRGAGKDEKKMTGKELWEKGLAGKGDDWDEDDVVDALANVKVAEKA